MQAAAKVAGLALAGSFGALGCDKQAPVVNASTGAPTATTATAPTYAAPAASSGSAAACEVADAKNATAAELSCCREMLKGAIAAGPLRVADHGDCCGAVVYANEGRTPPSQVFPERGACCDLAWSKPDSVPWSRTYSCTPWGPPVPPEMNA